MRIAGHVIPVPEDFQRMDDDYENGKVFFECADDSAEIVLSVGIVDDGLQLPRETGHLIDGVYEFLAKDSALLEARAGQLSNGIDAVYTLIKHKLEPEVPNDKSGVEYSLAIQIFFEDIVEIQGLFSEPMGANERENWRDAQLRELHRYLKASGELPDDEYNWWRDPYQPERPDFVMNWGESRRFDHLFPNHPLTLARAYLTEVLESVGGIPEVERLAVNPDGKWGE